MLEVKILSHDELPKDLKEEWKYRDYNYFLLLYHDGKLIEIHCDGMEPEDAMFCRDLNWVPSSIEKAYKLGLKDGNSLDYLED